MPHTNTKISDEIFGKCIPAASIDTNRVDGITLTNIAPTKPSEIEGIYAQGAGKDVWRIIGNLLEADFRGKACQAKVNGMAEWIKGTAKVDLQKRMNIQKLKTSMYRIQPFVLMEVKNPINNYYWSFKSGQTDDNNGNDPADLTYDWKGIVSSQRGIPADIRWFGAKSVVTISGKSSGGQHIVASYKVLASKIVSGALWVYLSNIGSNAADPIYVLSNDKRGNPTYGVLTRGLPNVTRAESYCDQIPGLNTKQFKPYWIQETRRTIKEDEEWKKFAEEIRKGNPYFAQFGDVESVEWYRQMTEDYDNRLVESFLHNPALANQTLEGYTSLEQVQFYAGNANSPLYTWSGRYYMYRANAVGYFEQLAECTDPDTGRPRLIDMQGAKLDIQTMKEDWYRMQQVRISNGLPGQRLEFVCHSRFREKVAEAFYNYFKQKAGGNDVFRMNAELLNKVEQNPLGFTWRVIRMDWPSVEIALVSHPALDYRLDAHKKAAVDAASGDTAFYQVGNVAFMPDWSTAYRMLLDSGTATRETGEVGEIATVDHSLLCGPLMTPKQTVKHYWEVFTQVVECPLSQIAYENFDDSEVLLEPAVV